DLLGKLGATLDLKNHAARLQLNSETNQARIAELHQQLIGCEQAFNRADEAAFADCLDPQAVTFTIAGDFYARDAAMEYYRTRYLRHDPPAQLFLTPRAHHAIGEAFWVEYDLRVELDDRTIVARGTALCQRSDGKWRIVHMNHSTPPGEGLQAQGDK